MEISYLLLFKTINYFDANRHENFCRCAIGRIDATAIFSQTVLIILIQPVHLPMYDNIVQKFAFGSHNGAIKIP